MTTTVSSTSATTPVARLAYQSAVLAVIPTVCLLMSTGGGGRSIRPHAGSAAD